VLREELDSAKAIGAPADVRVDDPDLDLLTRR
jgi:hypothetical protein